MRVFASFVGGWGHAEPVLAVANRARLLGHRVTFAGQRGVIGRLSALGFETEVVGPNTLASAAQPLRPVDRAMERAVLRDHFVSRFGRERAQALGALYDRDRPDLVICDQVDVGSVVAAELRGIPCVTVVVLAAGLLISPSVVGSAWDALREEFALGRDPDAELLGGDLMIAPIPRSLRSPRCATPSTIRFVRPPVLDDVGDRRGPPLVYATLGTIFNMECGDLLARLVDSMNAVSDTNEIDVVITTGPGIDSANLPGSRPRLRVEEFVPQRELLGRCRAVVSHAGSGTLAAALSLGIPVVNLPMGADQPDNADRCEELGVGITLDPLTATTAEIVESTQAALHDPALRAAVAMLASEAASQPVLDAVPELRRLLITDAG